MTDGLTFNVLRSANEARLPSAKYRACEETWTPAHWLQALIGELGELANIMKKIDRGDFKLEDVKTDIEKEFADVQTYLDIMAFKMGINLGQVTLQKFNEVSERIGSAIKIREDGSDWHL